MQFDLNNQGDGLQTEYKVRLDIKTHVSWALYILYTETDRHEEIHCKVMGTSGQSNTLQTLAASAGKSFDNKQSLNSGTVLRKHTWLSQLITVHKIGRFSH